MINLKSQLQNHKTTRSQILTVDKECDILLKETLQAIDAKIQEYQDEHKEQIIKDIEKQLNHITEYMDDIHYLPQITSIYNTDLRKQTESMITYLDTENQKTYKKKMSNIVQKRQTTLMQQLKS